MRNLPCVEVSCTLASRERLSFIASELSRSYRLQEEGISVEGLTEGR